MKLLEIAITAKLKGSLLLGVETHAVIYTTYTGSTFELGKPVVTSTTNDVDTFVLGPSKSRLIKYLFSEHSMHKIFLTLQGPH